MKKFFLLVLLVFLTNCGTVLKTVEEKKNISENVNYSIDKVEYRGSMTEGNVHIFPKEGYKFAILRFLMTNNSNVKEDLDFNEFYILDITNKTKYSPESVYTTGLVWMPAQISSHINKKSKKKRNLVYVIPKEMDVKYTMINGKMDVIKFK